MSKEEPNKLVLKAPLSGYTIAIEDVPDPVFSAKMVGDGISIDPLSQCLLAPCAGQIVQIHPSHHALTLRHASGLEVLMHVGLDTVGLRGQGFTPLVKEGEQVECGDRLLEFDADSVAQKAKSLMTEILIANMDLVEKLQPHSGRMVAGQSDLMTVFTKAGLASAEASPSAPADEEEITSAELTILNPVGLHARPAAVLAKIAKCYQAKTTIHMGSKQANCRSVSALMALQTACGSRVTLSASGPDAAQALKALEEGIASGLGEDVKSAAPAPAPSNAPVAVVSEALPEAPAAQEEEAPGDLKLLKGVAASPGVALGYIYRLERTEFTVKEKGGDVPAERAKLERALEQAKAELEHIENNMRSQADPNKAGIFAAHRELLDDPDLTESAFASVAAGFSAAFAWRQSYTAQAEQLSALKNELLAARATDIRDIGARVMRLIVGEQSAMPEMPPKTILIAEDLTPSDTATLDRSKVMGFATVLGGATSHASILARSLDLPAVAGISPRALTLPNNTLALLDGNKGTLKVNITPEEATAAKERIERQEARRLRLQAHAHEPALTKDGHRVEIVANVGSLADTHTGVEMGAEGVGLLRSEFLFMGRNEPPTEEEQAKIYCDIARVLGPDRPLVIRTLDVGGDKPLPYLPIPKEANPFLGERGIRVGLRRPQLLRTQFRAIMQAAGLARVHIMLPMVSSIDEFRQAQAIYLEEKKAMGDPDVPLGIMIEVPAAAMMAETLAKEAEFFSIGTNDLTQYTLAIDRGHPKLAAQADGLSPAVLRLIKLTVKGSHASQRWTGVCGGIAGELPAVPILVGLGVNELSVAAPAVPAVKDAIRQRTFAECQNLAAKALQCANAAEVRALVEVEE